MRKRRFGFYVLVLVLLAVFCYSLSQVIQITGEYRSGEDSYEQLDQFISMPDPKVEQISTEQETEEETTDTRTEPVQFDVQWPEVDFESLVKVNDDIVGWIYIPDTVINYPIVQGEDNDYYLNHLFNGQRNSSGCIFLDCYAQGDFTSRNSVLHGHHMRNDSMFARICQYKKQDYYDRHPLGLLLTPEGKYVVQFFSGYVCSSESDAWDMAFSPEGYENWLAERMERSAFDCGVIPTALDRVVTLSTCTYEFENARFVLHGILTPVQE